MCRCYTDYEAEKNRNKNILHYFDWRLARKFNCDSFPFRNNQNVLPRKTLVVIECRKKGSIPKQYQFRIKHIKINYNVDILHWKLHIYELKNMSVALEKKSLITQTNSTFEWIRDKDEIKIIIIMNLMRCRSAEINYTGKIGYVSLRCDCSHCRIAVCATHTYFCTSIVRQPWQLGN